MFLRQIKLNKIQQGYYMKGMEPRTLKRYRFKEDLINETANKENSFSEIEKTSNLMVELPEKVIFNRKQETYHAADTLIFDEETVRQQVSGKNLLDRLIKISRGEIESALVISADGLPLFHSMIDEEEVNPFSAGATALVGALYSALNLLDISGFIHMDIKLGDSSHLIIRTLNEALLVVKTVKDPNLGLIYLVIDKFVERIKDVLSSEGYR